MRVVVTGATGNVGSSLLSVLGAEPAVTEIIGIARRPPTTRAVKVQWAGIDVAVDDLDPIVDRADAVVHLSWLIQPSRDRRAMWATNVVGTRRVVDAVARSRVPVLIAASSVGACSPARDGRLVDESWPVDGVPESTYSWQKALEERTLDALAARRPACRVVRLRPALIFKRGSARHVRNLFIGRLLPRRLIAVDSVLRAVERLPIPIQVVHADDVAAAIHRGLFADVSGPFNLAAPGIIGRPDGRNSDAVANVVKPIVAAAWRARLVPVDPGLVGTGRRGTARCRPGVPSMFSSGRRRGTPRLSSVSCSKDCAMTRSGETPPLAESKLDDDATTEPVMEPTAGYPVS